MSAGNYHYSLRNGPGKTQLSATSRRKPEITQIYGTDLRGSQHPSFATGLRKLMNVISCFSFKLSKGVSVFG
jgi:hypothetical protein